MRTACALASTLADSGSTPSLVTTTRTGSRPPSSRTVSSGSSRRTVPAPTITASTTARSWCTARRLSRQRDPARVPAGRRHLAVERHRRLVRDQRQAGGVEVQERRVLLAGTRAPHFVGEFHVHAAGTQASQAAPVDERVGIADRRHDACHTRGDESIGTGRRESLMAARLERAIQRGAGGARARLGERHRLRVRRTGAEVVAAADDLLVAHEHGADQRVGMGAAATLLGQGERLFHMHRVVHEKRPAAVLQGGRRRGAEACFSHPDCDRRPRSSTWSASEEARGLLPPVGTSTPP